MRVAALYVLLTPAPIRSGKYIYTITAPAVGPNPAQYKAMVMLAWDFSSVGATRVRVSTGQYVDPKWGVAAPGSRRTASPTRSGRSFPTPLSWNR